MGSGHSRKRSRALAASLMLAAFAARALITPGFMPADGRALALEICPEGFPAQLLPHALHRHHHHGGRGSDHCVFAGVCPSGPMSELPAVAAADRFEHTTVPPLVAPTDPVRVVYLPPSRAPPAAV